jgi:hypothetical protein
LHGIGQKRREWIETSHGTEGILRGVGTSAQRVGQSDHGAEAAM